MTLLLPLIFLYKSSMKISFAMLIIMMVSFPVYAAQMGTIKQVEIPKLLKEKPVKENANSDTNDFGKNIELEAEDESKEIIEKRKFGKILYASIALLFLISGFNRYRTIVKYICTALFF